MMSHFLVFVTFSLIGAISSAPQLHFPFDEAPATLNTNICNQGKESGLCLAYFPSYFYNASTGKCEDFIYGGCGGNGNRFATEDECMKACGGGGRRGEPASPKEVVSVVDNSPAASASASANPTTSAPTAAANAASNAASVPTATANAASNAASAPTAAENEVDNAASASAAANSVSASAATNGAVAARNDEASSTSVEASEASATTSNATSGPTEDICKLPKEVGLCYAILPRFYFNGEKCEAFDYGGCFGNKNNFESEEECNKACPSK